jgi:23S rRNA (cytosine1962-C5)-methyltransferase
MPPAPAASVPARVECADEQPVSRRPPENAWRSTHPWIFQKLVEKPAQKPKPGAVVDVVGVDGEWIGRGFYNGHSRIALRMVENEPDALIDADWFMRRIGAAVDCAATCWGWTPCPTPGAWCTARATTCPGWWWTATATCWWSSSSRPACSATANGSTTPCASSSPAAASTLRRGARAEAGKLRLPRRHRHRAGDHHRVRHRFRADPAGAHKTGFFADQRENREWLAPVAGKRVLDLCCNTGGFGVYAAARGAPKWWASTSTRT